MTEQQVLERIEHARRAKAVLREERITMAHGAGGKASRTLVDAVFLEAFRNPLLEPLEDQAVFELNGTRFALTTDSFVVSPLFFPGGNVGDLAVNGTVNDLAVCGARPLYLTAGFILEEGFPTADLKRIAHSMAEAAAAAGVAIVAGDTKVVPRGKADGCFINTSGVGVLAADPPLRASRVTPGDAILVSGPIGDHGTSILLARGELDLVSDLRSDTAPLWDLVQTMLQAAPGIHAMRDATRGGVATVLNEIATSAGVAMTIDETAIPVRREVRGACEILGIDPLYVACEGRLVAFVDAAVAPAILSAMHAHPLGQHAAIIGKVNAAPSGMVLVRTQFGGTRIVDLLVGDPLPRIC
ncbi:MAG: hydrogenase expression/formation protein HypE [Candidatus Solibacter sp.]